MNRVCSVCVMDSSNPFIAFDANGQCNCCRDAIARRPYEWWPGPEGEARMAQMSQMLKAQGRGKSYDAMIGLSGGIDSAYLAHIAVKKLGLRVLAVHVDGGWNSEPAVHNIETMVRGLGVDLYTYVVEWAEMRDLQLAFLKASVLNQDIPQDHAFLTTLYHTAAQFRLSHFLSGVNFSSECVEPPGWGHPSMDGKHARAIHQRFGSIPLETFPFMGLIEFLWIVRIRKKLTVHRPLSYMNYDKVKARQELTAEYGWRDYGGKHCESRFTKFYQELYLPRKFGFDKRRLHFSSLIVSGQMTRDQALAELARPVAVPEQMRRDLRFVGKKLGVTGEELDRLIAMPAVEHDEYPNGMRLHGALSAARPWLRRLKLVD